MSNCSLQGLSQFTLPPAICESICFFNLHPHGVIKICICQSGSFNLYFLYYGEGWVYFHIFKSHLEFPGKCLCTYFAQFQSRYWSFSYWFVGRQIVVPSFSCLLSLFLVFFVFLGRILKMYFRRSLFFLASVFYIMFTKAFPTSGVENNAPVFSSCTFKVFIFFDI